jgi:hypothetical protein
MNPLEQLMSTPNRWPFNLTLLFNPFGSLLNKKALRPHIAFNPPWEITVYSNQFTKVFSWYCKAG